MMKRAYFTCVGKRRVVLHNCYEGYVLRSFPRYLRNNANSSKMFGGSGRKHAGLSPAEVAVTSGSDVGFRTLLRPLIFATCFSGCCFVGASIWQYENMRKKVHDYHVLQWFEQMPSRKRGEIRQKMSTWWNNQTEGQKVASVIIAMNVFVFMLWRIPAIETFMVKYFLCSPAMKATCMPMFLSTFSHYSFLHMAANMYVLYSFSTTSVSLFGKEQFVALYCSAGVISSFFSHLYKVVSRSFATSLGASGALMAILSSSCVQFPDAILQVVFLPFLVIPAGHAIKLLMTVDTIGLLARWKLFDHASHLGGALFGIFYLKYGREYLWNKRETLMLWWHKIREGR